MLLIYFFKYRTQTRIKLICSNILVTTTVMALKILRNFGHLIENIHVNFYIQSPLRKCNQQILEEYFVKYGSNSFIKMSLTENRRIFFENIQTPFSNVKSLHIVDCRFGHELPFNRIFPNLQTLRLGLNRYSNPSAIRMNFLALVNLAIDDSYYKIQENDFEELLKLNPQLEKLEIYTEYGYSPKFISYLKEYCPNIRHLGLGSSYSFLFRNMPDITSIEIDGEYEPTHFDNIVKLTLHNIVELRNPFTFSKLQHLTVKMCYDKSISNAEFSNLMNENPQLKSLELQLYNFVEISDFFRNEHILSKIEKLYIGVLKVDIPSDSLLYFLAQNRSLKKFSLTGVLQNFRQFYNAVISRKTEFKIRNKAIEFTITKFDNTSIKYVLRLVPKFSEYDYETEEDLIHRTMGRKHLYGREYDGIYLLECCSYGESPHLISKKFDEYKNSIIVALDEIKKKENRPHNDGVIDRYFSRFYY